MHNPILFKTLYNFFRSTCTMNSFTQAYMKRCLPLTVMYGSEKDLKENISYVFNVFRLSSVRKYSIKECGPSHWVVICQLT